MPNVRQFNLSEAQEYGVETASILYYLRVLVNNQKQLNVNFVNNRYWINISKDGFENLFSYVEKGKLRRILYRLIELGLVYQGEFNTSQYDKTLWLSVDLEPVSQPSAPQAENQVSAPVQAAEPQLTEQSEVQAESESKAGFGWADIMPFAIEEQINRLIMQHGYDKDFYMNIWNAFSSKMDAEDEKVPTMDLVRKRFLAYAQATMVNFKQGNYRYNANVKRKEETKRNMIEKWRKYLGAPDPKIIAKLDLRELQTPVGQVWDAYINKNYQSEVPLKNKSQLEVGFTNYLHAWIKNQQSRIIQSKPSEVDYNDTSWANDLQLRK